MLKALVIAVFTLGLPALAAAGPLTDAQRTFRFKARIVKGERPNPQAFYVLQRSRLSFAEGVLSKTFVPAVIDSVNDDPF